MALFRRKDDSKAVADRDEPEDEPELTVARAGGPRKKESPTPTRKQAEAARRQRLTRKVSKKDAARERRAARTKAMQAQDNTPEKVLLRDYVDARRNIGEYMLPGVLIMFVGLFLAQLAPGIASMAILVIYVLLAAVAIDIFVMWRGFKRVLAQRLPRSATRGLLMYGMNRAIQFRRMRRPAPRIRRGDRY